MRSISAGVAAVRRSGRTLAAFMRTRSSNRTKGPVQNTPVTKVENRKPALYAQQMAGKVYRIAFWKIDERLAMALMMWRTHSGGSLNSRKAQNTLANTKNFSQLSLMIASAISINGRLNMWLGCAILRSSAACFCMPLRMGCEEGQVRCRKRVCIASSCSGSGPAPTGIACSTQLRGCASTAPSMAVGTSVAFAAASAATPTMMSITRLCARRRPQRPRW
mmetsp:Transcript_7999/g.23612  ORF Transcript_7999/g.23612 Transcript_7999/m.23612 type:complete len:220 (+) Transcript_7999:613-1272(+)